MKKKVPKQAVKAANKKKVPAEPRVANILVVEIDTIVADVHRIAVEIERASSQATAPQ